MLASDLNETHVGMDLTITVGAVRTGGTIRKVNPIPLMEMVSVDLDGQEFVLPEGKFVTLAATRAQTLTRRELVGA